MAEVLAKVVRGIMMFEVLPQSCDALPKWGELTSELNEASDEYRKMVHSKKWRTTSDSRRHLRKRILFSGVDPGSHVAFPAASAMAG